MSAQGLTLRVRLAERGVDVELDVAPGRTLALIGANGAGKSSVVALVAGLVKPDAGRAELGARTLFHIGAARADTLLAPHLRGLSMVTQQSLLFPRMSVLDNVAFSPRCHGEGKAQARRTALEWLEQVGSADLAQRPPGTLSGGQAQRVALARALAGAPDLLLLDEPLSALDVAAAAKMRHLLRTLLADRTTILVTHDVLDTVLLADEVAVMEGGRIVESGPADAVMAAPRFPFAARFFGWNLIRGAALDSHGLVGPKGAIILGQAQAPLRSDSEVVAAFRPAAVSVHLHPPEGSPRNTFTGPVTGLEPMGHLVRVRVGDLSADVTPESVAALGLGPGVAVHLAVKAAEVSLYPA